MKWTIYRDGYEPLAALVGEYEYEYWFIHNDKYDFPFDIYVDRDTRLFEILKTFDEKDMEELSGYVNNKDYPPIEYFKGEGSISKARELTQMIVSDFIYGDEDYKFITPKENNKDTIYTINDSWDKGNVKLSISKFGTDTTVAVFGHCSYDNVSGKVLLENLLFAIGGNLSKYGYVTANSLARNHSILGNSLEELIERWDKDESVKVVSISKTTNDYSNIDQFIVTLHDTGINYRFENYIIEVKR